MHHCHATGCQVPTKPEMFMCKRHWFSLPKRMRDRIWATYRPGQCDDWRISHAYAEAAREAVRFIAAKEGKEADVSVYDMLDPERGMPLKTLLSPWQAHVQRWKDCRRCGLCDQRDRICLARGQLPCDVLFVGEAPGESEDALGEPFKGPAGKKLDSIVSQALHAVAPDDHEGVRMAYTNLVACFPKENKRSGNHEPDPEHIEACAQRLEELVRIARPKLIVCVGKLAEVYCMESVLRTGKRIKPTLLTGCDCKRVAIVHPSAILQAKEIQKGPMQKRAIMALAGALEGLTCSS